MFNLYMETTKPYFQLDYKERCWARCLFGLLKTIGGIICALLIYQSLFLEDKCVTGAILGIMGACASFYGAYRSLTGKSSM